MLSFNTLYNNYILIDVNKEFHTDYQMCVTIRIIFHYILIKKNPRIDVPSVTWKDACCTDLQACVC